jgi:low temperature requirement protein LtrA
LGSGPARVTNVELFFDLVLAFAVTQLSQQLLNHLTLEGAVQTAIVLGMVWLAWIYTAWVTNYLDPERMPVRAALLVLALVSFIMSAALPDAFTTRGLAVGGAYAALQIGRSVFCLGVLRGVPLHRAFQRVLAWCALSGVLAVLGGIFHGHARELLWFGAVGADVLGGSIGFYTPGLGRSHPGDWPIEGGHLAARCQAFVLIALGESVVALGGSVSGLRSVSAAAVAAFVSGFIGTVSLWWIYFDRHADDAARIISTSHEPGRLGRSAYHFIHPIMISGIIVVAAADERVLNHASHAAGGPTGWLVLGGAALFLIGHAMFRATVWVTTPWTRIGAVVVLGALGLVAPHVPAWALSACAAAVVVAVAAADHLVLLA